MGFGREERYSREKSYGQEKWLDEEDNECKGLIRKKEDMDDHKGSLLGVYFIFDFFIISIMQLMDPVSMRNLIPI